MKLSYPKIAAVVVVDDDDGAAVVGAVCLSTERMTRSCSKSSKRRGRLTFSQQERRTEKENKPQHVKTVFDRL